MCLLNPPAFTVVCVRCKRVTQSEQKQLMDPRRQSAHSGDVAFGCTVISAGHSSYLGSCCINIVVPISFSLLPLLLRFYLSLRFSPTPFPPLSLSLRPPPSLVSAHHLLFPPLTLFSLLIHPSPPTVCLWVENTIIYSFVSPSVPVRSIYTGKYQVASWKGILYGVTLINQSSLHAVVSLQSLGVLLYFILISFLLPYTYR